jgi:hypothetical protein
MKHLIRAYETTISHVVSYDKLEEKDTEPGKDELADHFFMPLGAASGAHIYTSRHYQTFPLTQQSIKEAYFPRHHIPSSRKTEESRQPPLLLNDAIPRVFAV